MDAASQAIQNFLKSAGTTDTTVDQEILPAVEHQHKTNILEEREQKVVEKERHQDHYHTTVQPLKDSEVLPEKHELKQEETQYKELEHDDVATTQKKLQERQAQFSDTHEEKAVEVKEKEKTVVGEHVHHHLHETIQPVIEKDVLEKTVVHKVIPIKEKHHEVSEDHGVTTNKPMSIEEFKGKLSGEAVEAKTVHDGTPAVDIHDKLGKHEHGEKAEESLGNKAEKAADKVEDKLEQAADKAEEKLDRAT